MNLTRAIELINNSGERLRKCLEGLQQPQPNHWPAVLRRESWIQLKRSWDLLRIVWLRDPRTRVSLWIAWPYLYIQVRRLRKRR